VPEYLAPGVYVEETSFRAKSIEGVSTSTTGFVGPTRKGPIGDTPEIITSLGDFQRIYGGLDNLTSGLNYVAHAVRNYFDNGGSRLYVSRVFLPAGGDSGLAASALVVNGATAADQARFVARFPGAAGNGRLVLRQADAPATVRSMGTAVEGTLLRVGGATPTFFVKRGAAWLDSGGTALNLAGLAPTAAPTGGADFLTLSIIAEDADGNTKNFDDLGFDRGHPRWIGHVLAATPSRRVDALENLYALQDGANVTAFALRSGLFTVGDEQTVALTGGDDGIEPTQAAYEAALGPIATLEDVSIVAAPGHSALTDFQGIQGALISHCERRRAYRISVLDTPPGQAISEARTVRSRIDSTYAALYYPWVVVANPLARPGDDSIPREITLPPSGFVCGIYARTDVDRGVFKAPANEIVRGALRFESDVNFAQQEVLNPLGVNCLRYLSGRGFRLWGARTASSDPEWKYVNVRRYFNYLEASIDRSTQWAVFEPNGERLWANVRETVEGFLYGEWRSGALLGGSPKEAFFVRCDRSTMTQNDLDNGRLVCLIGVAVVKPAEFVIFRIGQKTADARN
jgi:phage tail sheath protein FI